MPSHRKSSGSSSSFEAISSSSNPEVPLCPSPFDADPITPGNVSFKGGNESLGLPFSTTRAILILQEEIVATQLLLLVQLRIELIDPRSEVGGIPAESNIEVLQEFVAACEQ